MIKYKTHYAAPQCIRTLCGRNAMFGIVRATCLKERITCKRCLKQFPFYERLLTVIRDGFSEAGKHNYRG